MLKSICNFLLCLIGEHDWTSKAMENIPPSEEEIEDPIKGFWNYSAMYCKRCGKPSKLNKDVS